MKSVAESPLAEMGSWRAASRGSTSLLPINGLTIRPLGYRRVVMDAEGAAKMTAMN